LNNSAFIKLTLVLFSVVIVSQSLSAKMYRYKNDKGETIVSSVLPPKYSQDGYEVLSDDGVHVIETVAPRKTKAQLLEDAKNKARLEEEARLRREQEQLDTILKNSYTDISDIERARDNELLGRDRSIMLLKQNIRRLTRLLEDTQRRAARDERLGREISKKLLGEIERFKMRIAEEGKEVLKVEIQKSNISERYASSIIRFSELKAAEQLRRYRPGDLASNDSNAVIYQCTSVGRCDRAWNASLMYASEHSTTELAWANEVTIMMRKPRQVDDISIMVTRINNQNGKDSSIVMEVRCNKSQEGEDFCNSETTRSIEKGFIAYLN